MLAILSLNWQCSNVAKSKNKNRSEVEYLRGRLRKLESQVKYYKQREHFFEAPAEEIIEEVEDISVNRCPNCKRGVVTNYDFAFAILSKCESCGYEKREKKKS